MNKDLDLTNEEEDEIDTHSLDIQNLDYVASSLKEIGQHLSELSREE